MTGPRVGRHARRDTDVRPQPTPPVAAAPSAPVPGSPSAVGRPFPGARDVGPQTSGRRPTPTRPPAVQVRGLTKVFNGRPVVDDVEFTVPTGTVCGLLGPNGAGKTTTVRMLATLLRPDGGSIDILGHDVQTQSTAVRSLISLTGQYASVDNDLTGVENLDIYGRLLGLRPRAAKHRARELVEQFGLSDAADRPIAKYSGGMRRRLDLAASMIRRPALLFLDEPTTGLDPRTRTQLWDIVRDVVTAGTTVVLTTQYLDEADALADQLVVIDHGRVVGRGTPETLKTSIGSFSLSIRLAHREQTEVAVQVMRAHLGGHIEIDHRTGELTAPVPDSATAATVIGALSGRGVVVGEFGVHTPSLDEVFLALTDERKPA